METVTGIIERKGAFRLSATPSVPLFAGARSAGIYHLKEGWTQPEKRPDYLELFWCESGTFSFPLEAENRTVTLSSGNVMFLFPGDVHRQQVRSKDARYFWLTIDGHPNEVIQHYNLTRDPFFAGKPPEELFQRLINELGYVSSFMEYQASCTALEIIHDALVKKDAVIIEKNSVEEFCRLVDFQFSNPICCVELLADQMSVSRVTLYRMIRSSFGCTPKEYLERRRLQEAIKLLLETRLSVKDVAIKCGYTYSNYFSRAFKQKMNCTPEEFRKTGIQQN